jgi:hypothetical protein
MFLFIVYGFPVYSQYTQVNIRDTRVYYNPIDNVSADIGFGIESGEIVKAPLYDLAVARNDSFRLLLKWNWENDSIQKVVHAKSFFLREIESHYYSFFTGKYCDTFYTVYFLGLHHNATSPEVKLGTGDSAVGTIRYSVICKGCHYPKKWLLYYIFYYNKKGSVVRHGLAYLKRGKR